MPQRRAGRPPVPPKPAMPAAEAAAHAAEQAADRVVFIVPPKPPLPVANLQPVVIKPADAAPAAPDPEPKAGPEEEAMHQTPEPDSLVDVPRSEAEPVVLAAPVVAVAPEEVSTEPEVQAEELTAEREPEPEPEPEPEVKPEPGLEPADGLTPGSEPEAETGTVPAPELEREPEPEGEPRASRELAAVLASAAPRTVPASVIAQIESAEPAVVVHGLRKSFGEAVAVDEVDLTIPTGSFYGVVGPNGAGKTTMLSMIAGLLKPDHGTIVIAGEDAARHPHRTKRHLGILPDRLRTFDRLTGRQLLAYHGLLRRLDRAVVEQRVSDLAQAFDLTASLSRPVSDYSLGMTKKVLLAAAMIHAPRVLVLDEPFESVDPVSSAAILGILRSYVASGGTVVLSSHGMDLVEQVCDRVAVMVAGQVLAAGTVPEVRGELTLEQRFIQLAGDVRDVESLEWLHTFSD